MSTLDWIGKKAVVNHHNEVPFHLLKEVSDLSVGDVDAGNLLVEGDNLLALKALLPYYAGQVKCIYIDPPYNTGNENWIYNDNVNSPEIRRWLGKVVGGEMEDLSRHDKWLCMIYPRLTLLREMLSDDGVIFISIDDGEVARLRLIMDEIFGADHFIANVLWQKRTSPDARIQLGPAHDHILAYGKTDSVRLKKLTLSEDQAKAFKNPDNDPRGPWTSTDFTAQGWRPNQMYKLKTSAGVEYKPPPGRCWANIEAEFIKLCADKRMWFGKNGKARPRVKNFLSEAEGVSSWTWWKNSEVGHNQEAKKEINEILGSDHPFETPKPVRLLDRILRIATNQNDLVLDSFAGSGTTGHAVLQLNKQDGGNRRFILVQMPFETDEQRQKDKNITRDVTGERLRRVCKGYKGSDGEAVPGLGGGVRYCKLGPTVFGADAKINPEVTFPELARHVFFTETGCPLPKQTKANTPLIGLHQDKAVYLLYNGILKDKHPTGGNVLTQSILADLPKHEGLKVVYGTACRFSAARLRREKIAFKQIPYEIRIR